jgi:hypothetical protein
MENKGSQLDSRQEMKQTKRNSTRGGIQVFHLKRGTVETTEKARGPEVVAHDGKRLWEEGAG